MNARRALVAIVGLAVAVRVAFAVVFLAHPLSAVVPEDTEAYHTLARAIAAFDWRHPAFAYLSPLYGFLLAPLVGLAPPAERIAVVAMQIAMEAATVVLLSRIAARLFGEAAGLVAGAFYAVYGIAVYYSAIVLPVSVMVLLMVLCVATALEARTRALAFWLLPGAALGLLALARPNAIVLLPILLWWSVRAAGPDRWKRAAVLSAGLASTLAPFAARSAAAGGGLSPFPVNGGINFYIGNGPDANGMYVSVEGVSDLPLQQVETSIREASRRAGRHLDARSASRYWLRRGLGSLRQSAARSLRLWLRKAALLLRAEEVPLNTNYGFAQQQIRWLRATLSFGVLMPLAATGLAAVLLSAKRGDRGVQLAAAVLLTYAGSVVVFFVSDRYRMPAVPLLAALAAHGAVELARARRALRARVWTLGVAVSAAVAVNYPLPAFTYPEYAKDYFQLGKVYRERGDTARAVAFYQKAIDLSPETAEPFVELASAYYFAGRPLEAEMTLRRALAVDPGSAAARRNLAVLYKEQGLFEEALEVAVDETQRAAIVDARDQFQRRTGDLGRFSQSQYQLGVRWYGERRLGDARYAFKRAAGANPGSHDTYFALALVSKDLRLREEACAAARRAVVLAPDDGEYRDEQADLCR